jgi:hypothetical protein
MKAGNLNATSREISLRDREATLARLIAEMEALRKLVHLEEMKLAGGDLGIAPERSAGRTPLSV